MKYPLSIRVIHWMSALIIVGLLLTGIFMTPYDDNNVELSDSLYYWHKSFGMLSLLFVLVRLVNRMRNPLQPLPEEMPLHEKIAAKVAHNALYVLMVIVPVLGYVQSSTFEYSNGISFFFMDLPGVFPKNAEAFDLSNNLHKWLSYSLLAVIIAHVAGALKHRFFDKENDVLGRM
ncbi:MAG: cytochrome b [Alphaproteobacteria bacterium]